jgi:hypothetical protein
VCVELRDAFVVSNFRVVIVTEDYAHCCAKNVCRSSRAKASVPAQPAAPPDCLYRVVPSPPRLLVRFSPPSCSPWRARLRGSGGGWRAPW